MIVGIRPEQFEDAALVDTYKRITGLTLTVNADVVESLGSDKYVHFTTEGGAAHSDELTELAQESEVAENEFVARLSAASKVAEGQPIELIIDTGKLVIFDAESGENLSLAATAE